MVRALWKTPALVLRALRAGASPGPEAAELADQRGRPPEDRRLRARADLRHPRAVSGAGASNYGKRFRTPETHPASR